MTTLIGEVTWRYTSDTKRHTHRGTHNAVLVKLHGATLVTELHPGSSYNMVAAKRHTPVQVTQRGTHIQAHTKRHTHKEAHTPIQVTHTSNTPVTHQYRPDVMSLVIKCDVSCDISCN